MVLVDLLFFSVCSPAEELPEAGTCSIMMSLLMVVGQPDMKFQSIGPQPYVLLCVRAAFHMPSCNSSLVITVILTVKYRFYMTAVLFYAI
jgi:hypothetical protein